MTWKPICRLDRLAFLPVPAILWGTPIVLSSPQGNSKYCSEVICQKLKVSIIFTFVVLNITPQIKHKGQHMPRLVCWSSFEKKEKKALLDFDLQIDVVRIIRISFQIFYCFMPFAFHFIHKYISQDYHSSLCLWKYDNLM